MTSTSISLSWIASPWLGVFLLGVAVVYYYSTKTDIPKIKGIPEIPGALPMYCPCSHEVADNSFGHLLQLGDVYSDPYVLLIEGPCDGVSKVGSQI